MEYEVDDDQQLTVELLEAIAEREDADPAALTPPLYEAIDPTALEQLFAATATDDDRRGRVEFSYRGYRIEIHFDETRTICIEPEAAGDTRDPKSSRGERVAD